jgi:hypothetical protein
LIQTAFRVTAEQFAIDSNLCPLLHKAPEIS